jgi:hypothetical protein
MDRMIAVCGLVCTECEGYLATQANDEAWKERLAERGRVEYGDPTITAAGVTCDGCLAFAGRLGGYCTKCEIRACGLERQVDNCGVCPDYETCSKIAGFIHMVPAVKVTLDAQRASLN